MEASATRFQTVENSARCRIDVCDPAEIEFQRGGSIRERGSTGVFETSHVGRREPTGDRHLS
jgi:hypothetical protein